MAGQGGTGLIGQVGAGGLNAAGSGALNAIGAGSASNLAGAASSGTFLDKLMADMTPKDYLIGGWSMLTGGSAMMEKNLASANAQKEYEYKQAVQQNRVNNLNSVPTLQNRIDANAGLNANAGL